MACASDPSSSSSSSSSSAPGLGHEKGKLFLCCGPSGAGKDTLLEAAMQTIRAADRVFFCHRDVTRPQDKCSPLEHSASRAAFAEALAAGEYIMDWGKYETRYGIRSDIKGKLEAGITVVANVSRAMIAVAGGLFPGVEVYTLLVTASEATLRRRLTARKRESPAEIEERIRQALTSVPAGPSVVTVMNEGTVASGAAQMRAAVTGAGTLSMWLLPDGEDSGEDSGGGTAVAAAAPGSAAVVPLRCAAQQTIQELATAYSTSPFLAHITLASGFQGYQNDVVGRCRRLLSAVSPITVVAGSLRHSGHTFRAVTVDIGATPELVAAHQHCCPPCRATQGYEPHLSLMYGDLPGETRAAAVQHARAAGLGGKAARCGRVAIVSTGTHDHTCWVVVDTVSLGPE